MARPDKANSQAEEQNRELAAIVSSSGDAILSKDLAGIVLTWNKGAQDLYGYTAEEMIGQPITKIVPEHLHEEIHGYLSDISAGRPVSRNDTLRQHKDGSLLHVSLIISPVRGTNGRVIGASTIAHDITERKRTEEARDRLTALVESSADAIIAKSLNGTITAWNVAAERIFGYSSSEIIGKPILMLLPPDRANEEQNILDRIRRGERVDHFETVRVRKNGERIDVSVSISPIRNREGTIVGASKIARDITDRKRMEEALREQALILDLGQVMVLDMTGCITLWGGGLERLYGYTREEAIDRISYELLQTQFPEPLDRIEAKLQQTGTWEGELVHRRRDGTRITVASVWVLHRNSEGRPERVLESNTDVTESRQAKERLAAQAAELARQAEELSRSGQALEDKTLLLQSVLDSMSEGLVAADENGKFILWNQAAERIVGLNPGNVSTKEWTGHYGIFLPDKVTPFPSDQNPLARAIQGESTTAVMFLHHPEIAECVFVEANASPLKDKHGTVRGGVTAFRDITESLRLEAQVRQSQKMEAVGRLAGGVAHDFNNILGVVIGYSDLAIEVVGPGSPATKFLVQIMKAANQALSLTRQLLAFSRQQVVFPKILDLNEVVHKMTDMLQRMVGEDVTLSFQPAMPIGNVRTDVGQIEQILMNLVVNARDAMPNGGRISIATGNAELDQHHVFQPAGAKGGQYVFLTVSDTGCGMGEGIKSHIFEPFFTTKGVGQGTGLGLSTVYGIVKQSAGHFRLQRARQGYNIQDLFSESGRKGRTAPAVSWRR